MTIDYIQYVSKYLALLRTDTKREPVQPMGLKGLPTPNVIFSHNSIAEFEFYKYNSPKIYVFWFSHPAEKCQVKTAFSLNSHFQGQMSHVTMTSPLTSLIISLSNDT